MAMDPITAGMDLAGQVIGRIWPDKSQQEREQLAAAVQLVQGQLQVNAAEAASPGNFKGGWRPFIGWVCGVACAWNWIGLPVAMFAAKWAGHPVEFAPANLSEMMPILLGMLGLGGLRTVERINGKA